MKKIKDIIKQLTGEDVVDVETYTDTDYDCIRFAQEKIREFETENARLKIENRRLADRNTALVSGTRADRTRERTGER